MEQYSANGEFNNRNSIKRLIFPIVYICVVTVGMFFLFSDWAYDDPFITYRYAENLAQGIGFVYNPGEQILSTTTPLFALVLTPVARLSDQVPRFAVLVGVISMAIGGLLVWDIGRVWSTPWVGWAGLILYPTFPLLVMTLGSETPLYLALCLGLFSAYIHTRYTLAGLLAALAVLTRPDGAVLVAILAGDFLIRWRESIPWKGFFIFLGLLVAWVSFSWIYFGSPIPVTLTAKQQQGSMAISQQFAAGFLTIVGWYSSWPYFLEMIVAIAGVVLAVWKKREWLLFLAWPLVYFGAYSILGVSRYFWYYAPLVPGFIVCIGLGVSWISLVMSRENRQSKGIQSNLITIFTVIVFGVFLFGQGRSLVAMNRNPDRRAVMYKAVGEWLETNTRTEDRVGALEVGIIGYYAQRSMVDFAGLLQPEVAAQLQEQTTYEDAAFWAVENFHPSYLVLQKGVFPRLETNIDTQSCEVVKIFRGEDYDYPQDLGIYVCSK